MTTAHPATRHVNPPEPGDSASGFDEFVHILSHDVRASIRALTEVPEWIADDLRDQGHKVTGTLAENLNFLSQHAARLDKIMVDLLAYSRIGRLQDVRKIAVAQAVETVVSEMYVPRGFSIKRDLGSLTLFIGETDILVLIRALISNAIKHHDSGAGEVVIAAVQQGENCVLRVQDDGPGIPEAEKYRVFNAMCTLKSRDEVEGSGLGLSIVKKIAEHYGGHVRLSDRWQDRGLRVEVTLPLKWSPRRPRV